MPSFSQYSCSMCCTRNATLLKTNNSIARINNSQGWMWDEAPEITARQHTSTQLCAGTGHVSSFLSPPKTKWLSLSLCPFVCLNL
ncbi:hypothetical protein J6590_086512 [Homalodisca vitripennis]|nr:hypothetical protein J6590_086512 [Homalodisca vitripennis]